MSYEYRTSNGQKESESSASTLSLCAQVSVRLPDDRRALYQCPNAVENCQICIFSSIHLLFHCFQSLGSAWSFDPRFSWKRTHAHTNNVFVIALKFVECISVLSGPMCPLTSGIFPVILGLQHAIATPAPQHLQPLLAPTVDRRHSPRLGPIAWPVKA